MTKFLPNIEFIDWIGQIWKNQQSDASSNKIITPLATGLFVICAALMALHLQSRSVATPTLPDLDSQIPEGKRMVEVEIVNSDFLDSVVGIFSVVNLYSIPLQRKGRSKLIAKKVQLMRSMKNPGQFVALADNESEEARIGQMGPYRVTIHNPKLNSGTEFVKPDVMPRSRIQFDRE